LDSLIETACNPKPSLSYKEIRVIETLLRDQGIENFREVTSHLIKLNVHDQDDILKYMDLFRIPSFFSLVESFGSIAQAATLAETSSQKVMEIVRALKYYSYTDKDKVEMIQINESIQASLVLCSNRVKHTIDVATEWAPDLPNIPCTSEINQIWTNLLNNACDAIEEMGEDYPGKIEIQTHHGDDEVRITIADNGAGIPEEKMDKIFDPFFTTKDIGKGTGLGLSIVSGILKKHHGTIGVTSQRGHTVFEIAIPVSPTFDPGKSTESHDEDPSKPSARIDAMTPSH
jgi:signal transduction histidine kinase